MPMYRYSYDSWNSPEGVRVVEERCHLIPQLDMSSGAKEGGGSGSGSGSGWMGWDVSRQRQRVHDQAHADAVLDLVAAEDQEAAHGRILISSSRDGAIKVWK